MHIRRVWLEEVQIPLVKLWTKDISYDPKKHIYKPNKLFRYNAVVENEILIHFDPPDPVNIMLEPKQETTDFMLAEQR